MDQILTFLNNLSAKYSELTPANKGVALGLGAAILASILTMTLWVQAPDYQLMYANLAAEDASSIIEELKSRKVDYELTNNGKNIRVPSNQVHELRINLASQGLPQGSEVGLELFDDTPLGMTDFVQKLNFQRALQGELSRTIKALDAVDQARIHLVIPKNELFLKEKPKGKASVMIRVKPGKALSESQIQGIVHLVSSSVEGIEPSGVVLVNLQGNMLSGQKQGSQTALITSTNYKHKKRVEKELEAGIVKMFEEALGPNKIIARVTADINFDKVERTEEIFDPNSQVVRSEQNQNESVVGSAPPGGVPGVQSLLPEGGSDQSGGLGSPAKRNNEKQTFNYEINKIIKYVTETSGEIQRLSVSILVDGTLAGDPAEYKARTPEEMAQFLEIIKTAVGFNEKRGDKIQLENVQFDKSMEIQQTEMLAEEQFMDNVWTGAKLLAGVILLMLFVLKILLPMVRWVTTTVEVMPEEIHEASAEDLEAEEERKRIQRASQETSDMRKSVTDFVDADPKYAAGILRKWLRERA